LYFCAIILNIKLWRNLVAVLREIVTILRDRVKVVKVDINKNKELSKALKISVLPTVIIFNNMNLIWRGEGFQDSEVLLMELNKFL